MYFDQWDFRPFLITRGFYDDLVSSGMGLLAGISFGSKLRKIEKRLFSFMAAKEKNC